MKVSSASKIIGLLLVLGIVSPVIPEAAEKVADEQQKRVMDTFNTRRANMNEYMDYIMIGVADWLRSGGVVPIDLPDLREGFSYSPLLIEYSGWVDLTNGKLLDIERVLRSGDCFMSYDRLMMRIEAEAALTSMEFTYDYVTTIMGLGIFEGYVEGYAENIVIHCDFLIDMYDFYIFMQDFEVKSIGYIDVRLRGNMLTDWIGNIMISIITSVFRGTITEMVSDRVKLFVQATLDDINSRRQASAAGSMLDSLREAMAKQGIVLLPTLAEKEGGDTIDIVGEGSLRMLPKFLGNAEQNAGV